MIHLIIASVISIWIKFLPIANWSRVENSKTMKTIWPNTNMHFLKYARQSNLAFAYHNMIGVSRKKVIAKSKICWRHFTFLVNQAWFMMIPNNIIYIPKSSSRKEFSRQLLCFKSLENAAFVFSTEQKYCGISYKIMHFSR